MYFALVPNTVTPNSSIVSHIDSTLFKGEPSYMTIVAPVASADTRYWNIIHPLGISRMTFESMGSLRSCVVEVNIASAYVTRDVTFT
jgi:hypothetical protein